MATGFTSFSALFLEAGLFLPLTLNLVSELLIRGTYFRVVP